MTELREYVRHAVVLIYVGVTLTAAALRHFRRAQRRRRAWKVEAWW